MQGIFHRTELLLGTDVMNDIRAKRVIIFGVGGVGSWCAESLVRTGISHLTIVDSDRVSVSNVNRQLMATCSTVGRVKVDVLRERLQDINPSADIQAIQEIYSEETDALFHLEEYDYIIDCIDSLKDKAALLLNAAKHKAAVFSSMGAALKIDPAQIKTAEFWKVRGCPLGAALRKKMRRAKLKPAKKIMCVYSEELLDNMGQGLEHSTNDVPVPEKGINAGREDLANHDWSSSKAQINGTLVHITAIFGFTLAGLVIEDIVGSGVG
jgi:tRNA A37 threonylcarbamoyladenosine dehydratase